MIAGILWGIKLRRDRSAADHIVTANRAAAEQGAPGSTMASPVAPSPPPLADEPIVAAAALDATPASIAVELAEPEPEPEAIAAPASTPTAPSDLTQLKGLGPKLVATLAELGITRLDQIAALTPDQAQDLDARLGTFRGRLARDRWIEQARLLAAGDRAAYEAAFGKLG